MTVRRAGLIMQDPSGYCCGSKKAVKLTSTRHTHSTKGTWSFHDTGKITGKNFHSVKESVKTES